MLVLTRPGWIGLVVALGFGMFLTAAVGGERSSAQEGRAEFVQTASPVVTPCDRFAHALKAGDDTSEVADEFGLPETVRVAGLDDVTSYICTSVRDESGVGSVLGVLLLQARSDGTDGVLVIGDAGRADASFNESTWTDLMSDHGVSGTRAFEHGYLGGRPAATSSAEVTLTRDVWQVLSGHVRPTD